VTVGDKTYWTFTLVSVSLGWQSAVVLSFAQCGVEPVPAAMLVTNRVTGVRNGSSRCICKLAN